MIPLAKLKKDVQFNNEITLAVDVMKGIAASRYFALEKQLAIFQTYFDVVGDFLSLADVQEVEHPFVQQRTPVNGAVLVTSNAGFLGGLNSQVLNIGLRAAGSDGAITIIGERGTNVLRDQRYACTAFPGIEDHARLALALAVRDHLVTQLLTGECGKLVIVYPRPVSFSSQRVVVEPLFPCLDWLPAENSRRVLNMIWESPAADVVEYVLTQWLAFKLDEIFALSRLAELSARVVHLEGSYQELLRRGKKLKQHYFRSRHEIIDRSMREVSSSTLLLRQLEEANAAHAPAGEFS